MTAQEHASRFLQIANIRLRDQFPHAGTISGINLNQTQLIIGLLDLLRRYLLSDLGRPVIGETRYL
jgi:hypothetical protein